MKHKSLVNKLKKIGAVIVEHKADYEFSVTMNDRELHWYKQGDGVTCLRSRRIDDHDDSYTDYHAGFFPRTLTSAVETLFWHMNDRQKKENIVANIMAEVLGE